MVWEQNVQVVVMTTRYVQYCLSSSGLAVFEAFLDSRSLPLVA